MEHATQLNLAQLNIGRVRHPVDDPRMADFMNNLALVNGLAERSEGFVWRLKDETGNATNIQVFDDPRIIPNMSVWKSIETLERFVWQTVHKRFYGRKQEWFERMDGPHLVLWWIPQGHRPTIAEAVERLNHLKHHGSSDYAFGWDHVASAKLWKAARCA